MNDTDKVFKALTDTIDFDPETEELIKLEIVKETFESFKDKCENFMKNLTVVMAKSYTQKAKELLHDDPEALEEFEEDMRRIIL